MNFVTFGEFPTSILKTTCEGFETAIRKDHDGRRRNYNDDGAIEEKPLDEEVMEVVEQKPEAKMEDQGPLSRKGLQNPRLSAASAVSERSRMYRETQQLPVMPPLAQVEGIKIESLAFEQLPVMAPLTQGIPSLRCR